MGRDVFKLHRAVREVQTKKPSHKAVLMALLLRADSAGCCHPSYDRIARDTCLSRSVVAEAIKYLSSDLKVIEWKRGHGSNQCSRPICNIYTLNFKRIAELAESDSRTYLARFAESESESAESESSLAESETRTLRVQVESGQVKKEDRLASPAPLAALPASKPVAGNGKPPSAALSPNPGLTSLSPKSGLSKVCVPDALQWSPEDRRWIAKREIGRSLTEIEVTQMRWLNTNQVRPN
jgi:Helix-turn-helix domain